MKSEDLIFEEIIDHSDGWLGLKGRRLVIIDIRAFSQMRKDLSDSVGKEQTRSILTRLGYFWGYADAAAMKRIFDWASRKEWISAGPRLQSIQGVSRCSITRLEGLGENEQFEMEISWENSFEAEQHLAEFGESNYPVCWMLASYASGYASFCMDKDIYFIEDQCRANGAKVCHATGKEKNAWGNKLAPYLEYLKSDDLQGKIIQLTKKLKRKQKEVEQQRRKLALVFPDNKILKNFAVVRSRSFQKIMDLSLKVSHFDSTVLVTGETGVGKEVLARYIHKHSHRSKGPFIAINCGALPDTLLESELFGHAAGAFTGAVKNRKGLFEEAAKGTIFLDEIGDISPAMQIKLLRVLQEREVLRLGENLPRKVNIRVIAATNRNLTDLIRDEKFREDLYYRLAIVEICVPPLRERKEDILPLARFFVGKFSKKLKISGLRLDASTLDLLYDYPWPGNIRELENAIERAAVVCQGAIINPEHLPPGIFRSSSSANSLYSPDMSLEQVEFRHIKNVLEMCEGNKTKAAEILGLSYATLWRKLKQINE
jgi:two-component system, NtrC family, response regulator HydG